jgi:ATP-binding cassette, subfamily F, member 3
MRVALAAVLFSQPDLLLLDEPTNYLDLEGTLWLIDYIRRYRATILIISHDRDLLDSVSDHILHLDQAKLALWRGNYSSFERQRREQQAILLKQKKKRDDQRRHLQSFVDRFRAMATKAAQAQSRLKMLAKMEPVTAIVDGQVLPFHLPPSQKPLNPPLIAMDGASTGYGEEPVLRQLSLTISDDDRIGLLGANGNGKSTFAKLISGRLKVQGGSVRRSSKLEVGFFAQHQIDDLDPQATPYQCVAADRGETSQALPVRYETPRGAKNTAQLGKRISAVEDKMSKFQDLISRIDETLANPAIFAKDAAKAALLSAQRGELERLLVAAEEEWLSLTGALDAAR